MSFKKLFIFLIMGLFLISMVSASFLPIKQYDEETNTVVVSNFLGLGRDYASATLTWGDTKVGVGKDVHVGTFDYTPLDEDAYISDLNLINLKNGNIMTRGKQYKILTYVEEDNYIWECDETNKTECNWIEDGKKMVEEWKPLQSWLNTNDFIVGETYAIGVFVDTEEGDHGDWIPTFMSFKIDEWSEWDAGLSVDLVAYYNFDETSGLTAFDSTSNGFDLTHSSGNIINHDGLLGRCANYGGSTSYDTGTTGITIPASDYYTVNIWLDIPSLTQYDGLFWIIDGGDVFGYLADSTSQIRTEVSGTTSNYKYTYSSHFNTWTMVTISSDATGTDTYIDGSWVGHSTGAFTGFDGTSIDNLMIGNQPNPNTRNMNGNVDEVGIWARTLTTDEITQLYNSGTGITYEEIISDNVPQVTLNSPANDSSFGVPSITFNTTVTDDIKVQNVSLYIDGDLDQTNSSNYNGTYIFTKALTNGEHNWSILAYDNNSVSNQSETRTFEITVIPPEITLSIPIDNLIVKNITNIFYAYVTDNFGVTNVSLYLDSVLNETNTDGTNATNYTFTKILSDGDYTWYVEAYDNDSFSSTSATRTITVNTTPFIEFLTPETLINYANITQEYIPIQINISTLYFENISYDLYNVNGSYFNQFYTNETLSINFTDMPDAHYHYNVTTCTTTNQCNSTETRHINHDTTFPIISGTGNLTDLNTYAFPINSLWNFTVSDEHLSECWYSNVTGGTNYSVTCNDYIDTTWITQGNKTLTYCANDTFGFETCATSYIWAYLISYDQYDYPDPITEGFDVTFNLTVNRTNIPVTTANLILNNTVYVPTTTAGTNGYYFEITFPIPDDLGNTTGILQDWYWNYGIVGFAEQNTSTENITVYELAIDDCSIYGEVILEFNLYDEEMATAVNESAGANVELDLRLTSKDDASVYLDFNKTWVNENNPQVCLPLNVLNNSQYWIDFTVGFDSTDHVWEFYYLDDGTLNLTKIFDIQTKTPITLFDLLTADSTSFLFKYFDQDGLAVDNAIVHVYRKYIGEGTFREVERAKSDLNGDTIVHLVEEDVIYYFIISQYGEILFISSQYTALCQTTPCEIQIEASGDGAVFGTDWDLIDGGAYQITEDASSRVVNLTYSVNETKTFNLTVYRYENDGSYTAIDTASSTGREETILITIPQVAGNVSFFASVIVDDEFINSEWVDFEQRSSDFFGTTLALFLAGLIILTLGLMAVTEGVGTLVVVILGVVVVGALGLLRTELSTGVNVVIYLVLAGGILLWKLTGGRR